jgi:tol-pal system protein YbgF
VATAVLLLVACNGKRMNPIEVRTARLEDQVAALERTQARLQGALDSLNTLVAQQTRELRERRAGGEGRVAELESLVRALQEELATAQGEIRDLKDRVRFNASPQAPPGGGGGAEAGGGGAGSASGPKPLYDAAYQDLSRGNTELALMGFHDLLEQYPTSELADNAQYWIGESYYSKADYKQALEEFRKVPANYPTGDKVPAALLKIGYCQQNLGHHNDARDAFQELIRRFPSSEEARLAKGKLSDSADH